MQTLQEVNAEQLARLFHHYKEALTQDCAPERDQDTRAWDRTPQSERKAMVAAARLALLELSTAPEPRTSEHKYFAQPAKPTGAAEGIAQPPHLNRDVVPCDLYELFTNP